MVKVGIVGMGFMGMTHFRAWQKIANAKVSMICEARPLPEDGDLSKISGNLGTGEGLKIDYTQTKVVAKIEDMLANQEIDLVDVCLPTIAHKDVCIAALKAGKNVVCEKPMARTFAQTKEMIQAAEESGKILMPAQCVRFWPEWSYLKYLIEDGRYGKVVAARFRRVSEPPGWGVSSFLKGQESGGALYDLHVHDLDFVLYCFGMPKAVFARGTTFASGATDHVMANYIYESGAVVTAEGSWAMVKGFGFCAGFSVSFEKATLEMDTSRGADALKLYEPGRPALVIRPEGDDGYVSELRHIADAISKGGRPTVVTAQDGVNSLQVCEAEEKSIQTGQIVVL
jgi:predicted dehydrogenase